MKYEIFFYDDREQETYESGIIISTDTSKSSICKKLGLDDPYKMEVYYNEDVIYIDYNGKPYCQLHEEELKLEGYKVNYPFRKK